MSPHELKRRHVRAYGREASTLADVEAPESSRQLPFAIPVKVVGISAVDSAGQSLAIRLRKDGYEQSILITLAHAAWLAEALALATDPGSPAPGPCATGAAS